MVLAVANPIESRGLTAHPCEIGMSFVTCTAAEAMRIAYVLLVHKNPQQVARLVRTIWKPGDLVYVNVFRVTPIDKSEWRAAIDGGEDVEFSFAYGRAHASFGVVSATLDAMDWSLFREYAYLVNLSGQCYPIKSRAEIDRTLGGSQASFIDARRLPCATWPACADLSRFDHAYYPRPAFNRLRLLLGRKPVEKSTFVRIPRLWPSLLGSTTFYGGSQWFALKREHVAFVQSFLESNRAYRRFFRRTRVPDEHFFQTLLLNSPCREDIVPRTLTYSDWRPWGGGGPRILTMDDFERLRASECLFARKFDSAVDAGILDRIDRDLLAAG